MTHVRAELEVSERRACAVVEQPRATNRYQARQPEKDKELVKRLRELSRKHPRYGYRRITALLRREGFRVNRKPKGLNTRWVLCRLQNYAEFLPFKGRGL